MSEHRSLVPPTDEIVARLAANEHERTELRGLLKLAQQRDTRQVSPLAAGAPAPYDGPAPRLADTIAEAK